MKSAMFVKKLTPTAIIPKYATSHSAGVDLHADLEHDITLKPGEMKLVGTGLAIEIPQYHVGLIYPRSGLGVKNGVVLKNLTGVIDSDYRGEIKVALINNGHEDFVIEKHSRIAQMVISHAPQFEFVEVPELNETERGTGGFGSTGKK